VPGVVYGHKEAVVPVTLPKKELVTQLNKGAHLFELGVDGKSKQWAYALAGRGQGSIAPAINRERVVVHKPPERGIAAT